MSELDELIERLDREGVIEGDESTPKCGVIPKLREMSELDYLGYTGKQRDRLADLAVEIEQIAEQWHTDYPPLFAVTGLKNAGKSSLVKGFLSEAGRQRTPTGIESDFATRRYVFWLPESWQGDGDVSPFEEMLHRVFGNEAERLSSDPEIASQQYREDLGSKGMQCPLVAYDRNLDDWKIGIVDCPDIETGDGQEDARLTEAREMLEKASRLCAAFVVIGQQENLERDIFWQILRIVREVGNKSDEFLVINKCSPKPASQIRDQLLQLAKRNQVSVESFDVFASYNFRDFESGDFPIRVDDGSLPNGCASNEEERSQIKSLLPTFFLCDENGPHPPDPISVSRLLQSRVQSLSSVQLRRQFQLQMATELQTAIKEANELLAAAGHKSWDLITKTYHEIPQVLLESMSKDGLVSPLQNRKLADKQVQMLIEEAPWTIGLSMRATNWLRQSLTGSIEFVKDKVFGEPGKLIREGNERLRKDGTKIEASDVARALSDRDAFGSIVGTQKNKVVTGWVNHAFQKFGEDFDDDIESLRPLVQKYYAEMSGWDKTRAHAWAVATLVVLIVAALMVAVDGGTTLYGVSLLEGMLVASGVVGAELLQARGKIAEAEKPLVEGQLGFLTAEIGGCAGLPPYGLLQNPIHVSASKVNYQLPAGSTESGSHTTRIAPFQVDESFMAQLRYSLTHFLAPGEEV